MTITKNSLEDFSQKRIITFEVNWQDAIGNIELFNGDYVEVIDYTDKVHSMTLYELN
jgi:hypothetical protein